MNFAIWQQIASELNRADDFGRRDVLEHITCIDDKSGTLNQASIVYITVIRDDHDAVGLRGGVQSIHRFEDEAFAA